MLLPDKMVVFNIRNISQDYLIFNWEKVNNRKIERIWEFKEALNNESYTDKQIEELRKIYYSYSQNDMY